MWTKLREQRKGMVREEILIENDAAMLDLAQCEDDVISSHRVD